MRNKSSIDEIGRKLRARELSAAELLETCLRRIDAEDKNLNAFIRVMADEARGQAAEADRELAAGRERGPLHGIPIAVKDLIDIKGLPTTAASRVRDGHRADADAAVVTQLRRAGAIVIGKTNLHEFAYGTTSEDSAFGPVRNPHDPSRSPGGIERWLRRGRRHRHGRRGTRDGHWRVGQDSGGRVRHCRLEADVWRGLSRRSRAAVPYSSIMSGLLRGRCRMPGCCTAFSSGRRSIRD